MKKIDERFNKISESLHEVAMQFAEKYSGYSAQVHDILNTIYSDELTRGYVVEMVVEGEPVFVDILVVDAYASEGEELDVEGGVSLSIETSFNDKFYTSPRPVKAAVVKYENDDGFKVQLDTMRAAVSSAMDLLDTWSEDFKSKNFRP